VQAEAPRATRLRGAKGVEQLIVRHAVLGLHGVADDAVAAARRTRVVAKAHQLGHPRHLCDEADVVQVQDAAAVQGGRLELLGRGVVGREHDVLAPRAGGTRELELGHRAAVEAEAQLAHQGKDARIGQRLDGVILAKARHAREGALERGAGLADAGFVVDVKRRAEMLGQLRQHRKQALLEGMGHGHGV